MPAEVAPFKQLSNVTDAKQQQSGSVAQPVALMSSSVARISFSRDTKERSAPEGQLSRGPCVLFRLCLRPTMFAHTRHWSTAT